MHSPKSSIVPADISQLYLLDIPTTARLLSTTTFAVRELCRSGELVYLNIGHKFLISHEAIRTFIRKREGEFVKGLNHPSSRTGQKAA
jgi:hypothetical protein